MLTSSLPGYHRVDAMVDTRAITSITLETIFAVRHELIRLHEIK